MKSVITFYGDLYIQNPLKDFKLNGGHFNIINLEAPVTDCLDNPYPGKVNLRMEKEDLEKSFKEGWPDVFLLGNNHIMDYGENGLTDTYHFLKEKNVPFLGAGFIHDHGFNPLFENVGDKKVAFINLVGENASPVYANLKRAGVFKISHYESLIDHARKQNVDQIILMLHWGAEEVSLPTPGDVELAHKIIDYGADLIIGHHAHRIQSIEKYNGKYIFYGLGNFAFSDIDQPSYYTEEGQSTRNYKKQNYRWNNTSLRISYDISKSEVVDIKKLYYEHSTITEKPLKLSGVVSNIMTSKHYNKYFKLIYTFNKITIFAINFWRNPQLPKVKHFKMLIRLITKNKQNEYV